ncbi:MAG: antibiotic biosynthesis monooxygenase [Anaerolineae bacterium]|nr:antibiotic biosynthesis monooxygenase [Anaerolineae bacterium]
MIVIYVSVQTREDAAGEFERIIREIRADILTLPGCIKNEWYRVPDSPCRYVTYGEFDTHEHFQKYLDSDAVKRIGSELMPLLAAPPEFRHYQATVLEGN